MGQSRTKQFLQNTKEEEPGSILGALLDNVRVNTDARYNLLIATEAGLAVAISIFFALFAGIQEAGFASLALASAAIVPRINQILKLNRERIWDHGMKGWTANGKSIFSGAMILIAMVVCYTLIASFLDRQMLSERFAFVGANYSFESLTPERFSHGMTFFIKNSKVLFLFFILAFFFRSLGTSLALGWNAGVWSISIVLMIRSGIAISGEPVYYAFMSFIAIAPHLFIEGLAYITGSLAGIFLSRGITLYDFGDDRMKKVLKAVALLSLVSVLILLLGAAVEHVWAPFILQFLQ